MMTTLWRPVCLAAVGLLSLTGCGLLGQNKVVRGSVPDSTTVTSPAFRDGAPMPVRFACAQYGGRTRTPPLHWSVAQSGVGSLALVIDDPDSPSGAYVHWVLFNIDARAFELLENVPPPRAEQAMNSAHKVGYAPPCPPKGEVHRYRFTLYALKEKVPLKNGVSLDKALLAIASRTIARGRMTATFRGAMM
ncbi:YbhB/YbcL family Raf kinase inhibitor-like protein [Actinoallomurus purpureus]|uniref:YbhB/YbcL family Raf kinase inhibitor-like protein n=1 Tax=Actinoallomurus purpureus TaxID=478114 RepID=UPI0020923904|nr:YbhB/YbcL family Raf kinase inhibitor-like protein [Actinoallomurus purpureus]MCO6011135.1 YbhB/YbcL family Raf kinase inhibitor-like protein [Actinoallomurus purpureus]